MEVFVQEKEKTLWRNHQEMGDRGADVSAEGMDEYP